jgi:hypothetical protein
MWVGSENLEKGVFVFLWNKRMVQRDTPWSHYKVFGAIVTFEGTPLGAITTFLEPLSPKGRGSPRICVSMAPNPL